MPSGSTNVPHDLNTDPRLAHWIVGLIERELNGPPRNKNSLIYKVWELAGGGEIIPVVVSELEQPGSRAQARTEAGARSADDLYGAPGFD